MLRAPFPWFGGKSRAADLIWQRLGDVPNYVEPFAGSLAVLLARPHAPGIETVNDLDAYLSNFWRALTADPEGVAHYADWPVMEADLHARHLWLVNQASFRERMLADPDFYDVRIAGWWVWGVCQWIGSGWCAAPQWSERREGRRRGQGVHAKRPALGRGGRGVGRQIPDIGGDSGAAGRGIHASGLSRKVPDIAGLHGNSGRGVHASGVGNSQGGVRAWLYALAERLRYVRVCCGQWDRILGPSPTVRIGVTGVILDPPYGTKAKRDPDLYAHDSLTVADDVVAWALAHGDDPKLRIALCGYEGEYDMPATWECVPWKANGGYGNRGPQKENARLERVWFSPHCLRPAEATILPATRYDLAALLGPEA